MIKSARHPLRIPAPRRRGESEPDAEQSALAFLISAPTSLCKPTPAAPGPGLNASELRNPQPQFRSHSHASPCLGDSVRDQFFRRTNCELTGIGFMDEPDSG